MPLLYRGTGATSNYNSVCDGMNTKHHVLKSHLATKRFDATLALCETMVYCWLALPP